MFELNGSLNNAIVYTDNVDEKTIGQIIKMLNEPITKNTTVRIMPDTHYGKGATIGTTIKLPENRSEWKISPAIVGVDLSCAMMTYRIKDIKLEDINLEELDDIVNKVVPAGAALHSTPQHSKNVMKLIRELTFKLSDKSNSRLGLGTLGGGNHFIELSQDENKNLWLTVHSGSRGFGAKIAKHHEEIAKIKSQKVPKKEIEELILKLKSEKRDKEIQHEILMLKQRHFREAPQIPYLTGDELEDYLHDINIADKYAHLSRKTMLDNIVKAMGWEVDFKFDSVHNNIDQEMNIIRKGATSAKKGELLLIPLNMKDGSLLCVGKGNPDWNYSAPHGAGRILSRGEAKKVIDLENYKEQMNGIYTSSVGLSTLDEAPDVYKPADEIISLIGDTVEIKHHLKPVYNFKAH